MGFVISNVAPGNIRRALAKASVAGIWIASACASGNAGRRPEDEPARLATVRAEARVLRGETTWVATGTGYELVARTRADIAQIEPTLDRQATLFQRVFGEAPAMLGVRVVRFARDGHAALVPAGAPTTAGPVVDAIIDERPREGGIGEGTERGQRGGRGGASGGAVAMAGAVMGAGSAEHVTRAWLSARASKLSGSAGLTTQALGETDDPRIPAWIESALPALAMDSLRTERLIVQLAAHDDSLIPLRELLTMSRPPFLERSVAGGRGDMGGRGNVGGGRGGGTGGTGGGMGRGRGGIGGIGGMGGMGGRGRGGMPEGRDMGALQGGALFVAEAASFARYVEGREGYAFVGAIADAQMRGLALNDVIATARNAPADLDRMYDEWRRWMSYRAKGVRR
jgi:hypothetical protein